MTSMSATDYIWYSSQTVRKYHPGSLTVKSTNWWVVS